MKTVFFSSDRTEVERISKKLTDLSIPCEIRDGQAGGATAAELELCVERDEDLSRAFMECVRSGIGLAKRKCQSVENDSQQLLATAWAESLAQI